MTTEDRISFSLDEIKAVVFECIECGARVALSPQVRDAPPKQCPRGHEWDWNVAMNYNSTESPFRALLSSLAYLRDPITERGFRITLEIAKVK